MHFTNFLNILTPLRHRPREGSFLRLTFPAGDNRKIFFHDHAFEIIKYDEQTEWNSGHMSLLVEQSIYVQRYLKS